MKSFGLLLLATAVGLQGCSTAARAPAAFENFKYNPLFAYRGDAMAYCADNLLPGWDWNPDQSSLVRENYLKAAAVEYPAPKWKVETKRVLGVTIRTGEEVTKTGLANPRETLLENPRFRVFSMTEKEVVVEAAGDKYKMKNVRSAEYVRRTAEHQSRVTAWKREFGFTEGHEDLKGTYGRGHADIADVLSSPKKVSRGEREMGPDYFSPEELFIWSLHSARSEHHQPVLLPGEKAVYKDSLAGIPQPEGVHVKEIGAKHAIEIAIEKIFDIYDAVTDTHRSYRAPVKDLAEAKNIINHELYTRIEKNVAQIVFDFLEQASDRKARDEGLNNARARLLLLERWINREMEAAAEANKPLPN